MPVPLPEDLVTRTARGDTVLFVGAGMSRPQLPGWPDLLKNMLTWAESQRIRVGAISIRELIGKDKLILAAHVSHREIGDGNFRRFLTDTFRKSDLAPTPAHRLLPNLRFSAILTTNYDKLIESVFPYVPWHTQQDYPELAARIRDRGFCIVKVHGDIDRYESIVLGQADYRKAMFSNAAFKIFLSSIFTGQTVLFVGYGLGDPDLMLFLEQLNFQLGGHFGPHFALMKTKGMNEHERGGFEESHGIRILGDDERDDHPDIYQFLTDLKNAVARVPGGKPIEPARAPIPEAEARDIRGLLEAMGQRIQDEKSAECLYFLGEYKSGAQIRRVTTCYVPRVATVTDVESLAGGSAEAILLAREPLPPEVTKAAEARGVQAYSRDEFIDRLADFKPYVTKFRTEYESSEIERYFVPMKIQQEQAGQPSGEALPLDSFIEAWLAAADRNHLSLLGDFGTGKTWFCRRLAHRLSEGKGRVPILIALRDYSKAYDIEQVLTDALANRFQVPLAAGVKTIQRLNEEGRLLLIFDGFDEMERRVSDYRTALDNFWQIAKLVAPRAKVILTCRTAFFRHRTEEKETLEREPGQMRVLKGEDVIDLAGKREFEVVHLTEFDEEQIREALRKRVPDRWAPLYEKIRALPKIEDLAHRPVLLEMIARTLPAIARPEDLNLASLYENYTDELLRRRPAETGESIPAEQRRYFVEELAWEMQNSNRLTIPFSEFPERVTTHFGLKDSPDKAAFFERDIRTQSYLVRDDAGNYKFAHKSMMEFFVARKLAPLLAKGEAPQCVLTNAVVSFVHYLLAQIYEQPRIEHGMVYVPSGPFIFGWEEQKNLAVASLHRGFWIDRYPVTNEDFCRFLNEQGNKKEGGVEWIELNTSRIQGRKGRFSVKPGYEKHPVVGVNWYGANAYAKSKKKQLPSEQEWEKAARGIDGRRYPWGEDFSAEQCNTHEGGRGDTSPVGAYVEKGRSPYGCEEMAGNVWEWTASRLSEGSENLVLRGGAWVSIQDDAACAFRSLVLPRSRDDSIGFRCART